MSPASNVTPAIGIRESTRKSTERSTRSWMKCRRRHFPVHRAGNRRHRRSERGQRMKRGLGKASVIAIFTAAMATAISAQWPAYPTPGVPRTADGKPNLEAPAPRTADGKVDFAGIWVRAGGPGGGGGGRGRGGPQAPPAPTTTPDGIPLSQFGEVAGRGYELPLQPWAA